MRFYNPNKLFIGAIGHTTYVYKDEEKYKEFSDESFAITKQNFGTLHYEYIDVISKQKYKDFHHFLCKNGDLAIMTPKSFSLYIDECCNNAEIYNIDKNDPFFKICQKVKKKNIISDKDIKYIIFELFTKKKSEKNEVNLDNSDYNLDNINENINTQNIFYYSSILTDKKFIQQPAVGRDNEVNELIITLAQDKKNPILVGMSGTGKTTIAEQLAYKIQKNDIPNFLKNKKIIELNLANLLAGTKYSGSLEEKVTKIINFAIKNNAIIFIDEIHTIYGAGTHDKSDYDIASMIKQSIDRQGLKVIGTTTDKEYDKYFSNDSLKRRFEKVLVKEPTNEVLYQIINKIFNDYSGNNNIKLLKNMDNIINILIELTNKKHRSWNDKVCNPDLVIGIIDKIFAHAKVNNQDKLTIDNIIYGINSCNRIYDIIKKEAIHSLNLEEIIYTPKQKIIQFKKKN